MVAPLLQTKLFLPPVRGRLVARPRLLKWLDKGLRLKLVLLSAPAGWGKTTLLSQWLSKGSTPAAWLTLDSGDNDLRTFLAYVIAALRTLPVAVDPRLPDLLRTPQHPPAEAVLIPLLNQLAAAAGPLLLVLDDYHLIENQEVHNATGYLLAHLPPGLHLVIAGRADPPLPLARLRARGELLEIRAADLRFSMADGEVLLNDLGQLDLVPEDVEALVVRTEGWAAGLHLAALALQDRDDRSTAVARFSGRQEYIAGYLAGEVLDAQAPETRDFLLQTGILEQLSAGLCAAVTGQSDSHRQLTHLREANLFLIPLDDQGHWYRYHQLFADLLQQRLLASQPEDVPELYLRASAWCEQHDQPALAVEYALRGGHLLHAATLIAELAEPALMRSEVTTFMRWVRRLPPELVHSNGRLALFAAWALLVGEQDTEAAARYLAGLRPGDAAEAARIKVVRSIQAALEKRLPAAASLAREALAQLPESDLFFRSAAAWNLSAALYLSGDREGGAALLAEVARLNRAAGNPLAAVVALCRLGQMRLHRGELTEADAFFQEALALATDPSGERLPVAGEALLGLGQIAWARLETERAREHLERGIALSKRWQPRAAIEGLVTLAHLAHYRGEQERAARLIAEAGALAAQTGATEADDRYVAAQEALLWLHQGRLVEARRWARKRELAPPEEAEPAADQAGARVIRSYEHLVMGRLLLAEAQPGEALALLDRERPFLEAQGLLAKVIELHLLRAAACHLLERSEEARAALATAVDPAAPERHLRPFVEETLVPEPLLRRLAGEGTAPGFVQELLAYRISASATPETQAEPLSARELEVLRLLQSDLAVPQIAATLSIATSTARSHIKSIYGKLGARSRFEAVARAREAGLL